MAVQLHGQDLALNPAILPLTRLMFLLQLSSLLAFGKFGIILREDPCQSLQLLDNVMWELIPIVVSRT